MPAVNSVFEVIPFCFRFIFFLLFSQIFFFFSFFFSFWIILILPCRFFIFSRSTTEQQECLTLWVGVVDKLLWPANHFIFSRVKLRPENWECRRKWKTSRTSTTFGWPKTTWSDYQRMKRRRREVGNCLNQRWNRCTCGISMELRFRLFFFFFVFERSKASTSWFWVASLCGRWAHVVVIIPACTICSLLWHFRPLFYDLVRSQSIYCVWPMPHHLFACVLHLFILFVFSAWHFFTESFTAIFDENFAREEVCIFRSLFIADRAIIDRNKNVELNEMNGNT